MMMTPGTISYDRAQILDFGTFISQNTFNVAFLIPELEADMTGIFKPFSLQVCQFKLGTIINFIIFLVHSDLDFATDSDPLYDISYSVNAEYIARTPQKRSFEFQINSVEYFWIHWDQFVYFN